MGKYFWAEDEIDLKDEEWIYSHTDDYGIRYFYKTDVLIDDKVVAIAAQLDPILEKQSLYPLDPVERPWGTYQVLYEDDKCKIKRIVVYPGKRLSLQSHKHRDELWQIISADKYSVYSDAPYDNITPKVNTNMLMYNIVFIPKNARHRIENVGEKPLVFIEIQTGESFDESDIIRYEDDYGRV